MDAQQFEFENGVLTVQDGVLTMEAKKGSRLDKKDLDALVDYLYQNMNKKVPVVVDNADANSVSFSYLFASKDLLSKYVSSLAFVTKDGKFISSVRNHVEPGHQAQNKQIGIFSKKSDALAWIR